jgi:phosphonate transport system permease protein
MKDRRLRTIFLIAIAIPLYIWSWNATQIDLGTLIQGAPKARPILTDLVQPSLFERGEQSESRETSLRVPCTGDPALVPTGGDTSLVLSSVCLNAREPVTIQGSGFRPNTEGRLYWQVTGLQGRLRDERFTTDASGSFTVETDIPPLLAENPGDHKLLAEATWEVGGLAPSEALRVTIDKIIETVFLALMATTFAAILAVPLSFLGARNIMPKTGLGNAVYIVTRTFFNLARSIEPLILATIFAIWVSFGPFAGVLALTVSTIANLGKLYSEAAESIDLGPLEAITATGANRLQVIWYAVVPQITPPYISFTVYHWDINVRMSTIIGFVGGGGIGMELSRWINQLQWNNAATAVWAIVIVVTLMDYASAVVREKLV